MVIIFATQYVVLTTRRKKKHSLAGVKTAESGEYFWTARVSSRDIQKHPFSGNRQLSLLILREAARKNSRGGSRSHTGVASNFFKKHVARRPATARGAVSIGSPKAQTCVSGGSSCVRAALRGLGPRPVVGPSTGGRDGSTFTYKCSKNGMC